MSALRLVFILLPFVGLAWVIAEIIVRDRRALVEMASDCEAFARAPAPPVEVKTPSAARVELRAEAGAREQRTA